MSDLNSISAARDRVYARIAAACAEAGRDPTSVRLVWVSKTRPVEDVEAAIAAGAKDFGENRVQEVLAKFLPIRPGVSCHLIGPVQSNKLRKVAQVAHWMHSLDSVDDLRKLDACRSEDLPPLQVLLQVNAGREATKSGVRIDDARPMLHELHALVPGLVHIRLRGLMTIGVNSGDPKDSREAFAWLRSLRDEARSWGGPFAGPEGFSELSMGMTGDLEVAVAEGSTIVRIGTALFGERDYTAH